MTGGWTGSFSIGVFPLSTYVLAPQVVLVGEPGVGGHPARVAVREGADGAAAVTERVAAVVGTLGGQDAGVAVADAVLIPVQRHVPDQGCVDMETALAVGEEHGPGGARE